MPKLQIDNDLLAEEFFQDACLMGIMSPVSDYHFCCLMRQYLGFEFTNDVTSEIQLRRKKRNYFFPVFRFAESNSAIEHVLYGNRHDGRYLLPECRHIDFVWMIHGLSTTDASVQQLIQVLRSLKEVQLLALLTADKVKHKQHLIL